MAPRTRAEVLARIADKRAELRRLGVRSLALFGSGARDDLAATSDLDFVVEFERKSFDAYMDLKFLLEDLFGCPVDLVIKDAIKPSLRDAILGEAVHAPGF